MNLNKIPNIMEIIDKAYIMQQEVKIGYITIIPMKKHQVISKKWATLFDAVE
jgi:hypothetical protein